MPRIGTTLRRTIESWFDDHGIRPDIVAEIEDSALVKVFGEAGLGIFALPACIDEEVQKQHDVRRIGTLDGARERFFGISAERRIKHPAVVAIVAAAKKSLFI